METLLREQIELILIFLNLYKQYSARKHIKQRRSICSQVCLPVKQNKANKKTEK